MIVNLCALSLLAVVVIICVVCIKDMNITINVNHNHGNPNYVRVDDQYDSEGNPKEKRDATIDDVLQVVNSIMLGQEENENDAR